MTTTTTDRLAIAYLTRLVEPGNAAAGQAIALLGAADGISLIKDHEPLARRMHAAPFDPDEEAARLTAWERRGIHLLTREDEYWPHALEDLGSEAPYGLWYQGDLECLRMLAQERSVSIVGARAATSYGEHIAREMASELSRDHLVVSGGAYGIDGAAHQGALAASERTVIVSASGLIRHYPAGHHELFARAAGGKGLVISEVYPDATPTKWRFLARNRLIAALTPATIVVEAGYRSGSINAANHAGGLGRKVGAVPGPVTSVASAGCHRLIRDHLATLVTSAEDVRLLTEGWNA